MKRLAIVLLILAMVAVAGAAWQGRMAAASGDGPQPSQRVLGVDEFMTQVDDHKGPVLVQGVVSSASPDQKILALIDSKEFEACGVTTCARYTLPVSWGGAMPSVRAVVRVRGQVQETDGKLVFVATAVDTTRTASK